MRTVPSLTVALAQWRPGAEPEKNLRQLELFAERAAHAGANLLVAPEYSHSSVTTKDNRWTDRAQPLDGPFVRALKEISRAHDGVLIALGMLEAHPEGKPFNTLVIVGPDGLLAVNRKIHLYDAFGTKESQWLQPSAPGDPELAHVYGWSLGGQTCYDLRFPEVTRRLVESGADLIVIPSQWMPGPHKLHHWRSLVYARAIESQCWVVAVGQPEPEGIGNSLVVSPMGEGLIELGPVPDFQVVTIDHQLVESARSTNPVARANRFQVSWRP